MPARGPVVEPLTPRGAGRGGAQNGAGKTTLVNILAGNLMPTHGDAFVFGESVKTVHRAAAERT